MRRLSPLLAVTLLVGCGGHGGGSSSSPASTSSVGKGPGRAVLTVKWPARPSARLIPNAANSIVVNLLQGTTVVASKTIPRPAAGETSTSTKLTGLVYGAYGVQVRAFPSTDGSGVSQAGGAGSMTVTEGTPGALSVAMGSTVAALTVSPAAPTLGLAASTTLTASATDATGAIVLLAAGGGAEALTWTSDAPAVATVAGTGPTATVTTIHTGTANMTAALKVDDAGGLVRSAPVAVTVAPILTLSPSSAGTVKTSLDGTFSQILNGLLRDGTESAGPSGAWGHFRWQAFFPLSSIPAGATIQSATLTTSISTINYAISHTVAAYPSATDTLTTALPTGTIALGSLSGGMGAKTVDATAALQALLAAGSRYAGIVVSEPIPIEGSASWTAPTLTITYSLP